jgi:hypothetical protein
MGINDGNAEDSGEAGEATREASPVSQPRRSMQQLDTIHASKDPLWRVSKEEALRLCRVWEDEMGMMYPVLDINGVIAHAQKLYQFMEAAHKSGLVQQGFPGADAIQDEDTDILKMVLATAMTAEAAGKTELGQMLFEYVHPAIDTMMLGRVSVKGIRLLVLTVCCPCASFTRPTNTSIGNVRVPPRQ